MLHSRVTTKIQNKYKVAHNFPKTTKNPEICIMATRRHPVYYICYKTGKHIYSKTKFHPQTEKPRKNYVDNGIWLSIIIPANVNFKRFHKLNHDRTKNLEMVQ